MGMYSYIEFNYKGRYFSLADNGSDEKQFIYCIIFFIVIWYVTDHAKFISFNSFGCTLSEIFQYKSKASQELNNTISSKFPFCLRYKNCHCLWDIYQLLKQKKIFTVIAYNLYFENYILKVVEMHIFYRFIQFCNFPHTM